MHFLSSGGVACILIRLETVFGVLANGNACRTSWRKKMHATLGGCSYVGKMNDRQRCMEKGRRIRAAGAPIRLFDPRRRGFAPARRKAGQGCASRLRMVRGWTGERFRQESSARVAP